MKRTLLIIAGSALATGLAIKSAPALAQAPSAVSEVNVRTVQTGDLDLSTRGDQMRLDRRLVTAASDVCGTASDADLKGKNDVRRCRTDVLSAARARANAIIAGTSGNRLIVLAAQD